MYAPYKKPPLIYGLRALAEALQANKELDTVLIKKGLSGDLAAELKEMLRERQIPYQLVAADRLERLAPNKNHQGVVAILSEVVYQQLDDIIPAVYERGDLPLFVMLDGVTDVRNMGAIARSTECFGAHALIVPTTGSARLNADAVKTSAGALHHLPICREFNLAGAARYLKRSGVRLIGFTEHADDTLVKADFNAPTVVVFGNEGEGISSELLELCDQKIRIPLTGQIRSLNVSVAVGITLYEASRQRSL